MLPRTVHHTSLLCAHAQLRAACGHARTAAPTAGWGIPGMRRRRSRRRRISARPPTYLPHLLHAMMRVSAHASLCAMPRYAALCRAVHAQHRAQPVAHVTTHAHAAFHMHACKRHGAHACSTVTTHAPTCRRFFSFLCAAALLAMVLRGGGHGRRTQQERDNARRAYHWAEGGPQHGWRDEKKILSRAAHYYVETFDPSMRLHTAREFIMRRRDRALPLRDLPRGHPPERMTGDECH